MAETHWIRRCKVTVAGASIDMSNMQVEFQVRLYDMQYPDWCYIRMLNLSNSTSNAMFQKGAEVRLEAGYKEGKYGRLMIGQATQMRRGKLPNGVDKYHDVVATVNRTAYTYAVISEKFDANWKDKDIIQKLADKFGELGAQTGFIDQPGDKDHPRALTLHGSVKDYLNRITEANNMSWHFDQEGKLNVIKNDGFNTTAGTLEINADSGMVGLPEQTLDGIVVKIFLNPDCYKGQKVHVDEKSIQRFLAGQGPAGYEATLLGSNFPGIISGFGKDQIPFIVPNLNEAQPSDFANQPTIVPRISQSGIYKIAKIDHDGNMEGQEWYTTLTCISMDEKGPAGVKAGMVERQIPEEAGLTGGSGSGAGGAGSGGPT